MFVQGATHHFFNWHEPKFEPYKRNERGLIDWGYIPKCLKEGYYTVDKKKFKTGDTYFMIFNYMQFNCFKLLFECGLFNIIYVSPGAINRVHPGPARNVLVIFELKENT